MGKSRSHVIAPLVLGASLYLLWYLLTASGVVDVRILPSPAMVAGRSREMLLDGYIWTATWNTVQAAGAGLGLGLVIGVLSGWTIAHLRTIGGAIEPYVAATQAIPAIALAPLLVLWVGYGLGATAILCAIIVFFPVAISTTVGYRTIDPDIIDAARVSGAHGWNLTWYIETPLALANILAGIRNGATLSLTGAVVGEFVMGGQGIGLLLTRQRDRFDTPGMFVTLFVLAALAIGVYYVIRFVEKKLEY